MTLRKQKAAQALRDEAALVVRKALSQFEGGYRPKAIYLTKREIMLMIDYYTEVAPIMVSVPMTVLGVPIKMVKKVDNSP